MVLQMLPRCRVPSTISATTRQPPRVISQTAQRMAKSTTSLEVEQKFNVTAQLRAHLDKTQLEQQIHLHNRPAVSSTLEFRPQPEKLINDTYYDHNGTLVQNGIWLRQRTTTPILGPDFPFRNQHEQTSNWEAKQRISGTYQSSQFREITGKDAVMQLAQQHIDVNKLRIFANIDTFRKTWLATERVKGTDGTTERIEVEVVIDTATSKDEEGRASGGDAFKHVTGEVELVKGTTAGVDGMAAELEAFMKRHEGLFPTQPVAPVGKLGAYFGWKERACEESRELGR